MLNGAGETDGERRGGRMTIASKRGSIEGVTKCKRKQRERERPNEGGEGEERLRCCKMPAHTKEQVSAGLRFQAEGADGITGMLTFSHNKGGPVHGRYVVLRENMHKRLRHYEPYDDDSYEMLFTG